MGRYVATTSKVIDGNTIEVRYGHGHQHRISIRLANIDTADRDTQGASSAAVFLSDLILNKQVKIEETGADSFGKTLAYIWRYSDSLLINKAMVDAGFSRRIV